METSTVAAPQAPVTVTPQASVPALPKLTEEQKHDLRKKVLSGQSLTLDEARQVLESMRTGQGAAVIAGEAKPKRKGGGKKAGMSDADLDASLDVLLK